MEYSSVVEWSQLGRKPKDRWGTSARLFGNLRSLIFQSTKSGLWRSGRNRFLTPMLSCSIWSNGVWALSGCLVTGLNAMFDPRIENSCEEYQLLNRRCKSAKRSAVASYDCADL
jgi:hypothetical protein